MRTRHWLALLIGVMLLFQNVLFAAPAPDLARGFVNPPDSARPWVYWFWLNGNVTREGITADLEAMKRAGIGGVLIMEVDQGTPKGPVKFMSDEWRALFKFVLSEADRLGLEVNMNNGAGWSGSPGPWVTPDKAMQVVVTTETRVPAGKKFEGMLQRPVSNAPYYRDIAVVAFPTPSGQADLVNLEAKSVSWTYISGYSVGTDREAKVPVEATIPRDRIIDLTALMNEAGKLVWDSPSLGNAGAPGSSADWTVLRIGHTVSRSKTEPFPDGGEGPECDKLSREALEAHFNGMIGKLVADAGQLAGKSFVSMHVDSWENGGGNWTPKMREEFKRLRGYDIVPFLPVLTGRFIDNVDVTERFLWDLRQTASDLFEENYVGHLVKLAHDNGLRFSMETYGTPSLDMDVVNHVDEPMCEFWWSGGGRLNWTMKAMASAAHVNGRPVVGAEAFTSNRRERWTGHPGNIKARGDRIFCEGVNRFVIHRYAMQPWAGSRRPGMSMGPYGLHYERTQTWWEESKAWHVYLGRCQYMLRQGQFVADILSLQPEEPMQRFNPLGLTGYDYDGISPKAFLEKITVENGLLVLPSGMKYRILMLPVTNTRNMSLAVLRKIKRLVEEGAIILGSAPEATPGLEAFPKADAEVRKLAAEMWGADEAVNERSVGKGKVFRGAKPEEVLAKLGVARDFSSDKGIHWIHRSVAGTEVYFLASDKGEAQTAVCTFRVNGKTPEVWNPMDGSVMPVRAFDEVDGAVTIPILFEPSGSLFVVFRPGAVDAARRVSSVAYNGTSITNGPAGAPVIDLVRGEAWQPGAYSIQTGDGKSHQFEVGTIPGPVEIEGPWTVRFAPDSGAPQEITFEKLVSWSKHTDSGVKYFSGTGTYSRKFSVPGEMAGKGRRAYLDLGRVEVMARVKVNGIDLGLLWKLPYRLEITSAIKAGENSLEISVVNLLPNRMIGDEELPDDSERRNDGTLKEWPKWLAEGKPSPTGRFTFGSWRLYRKGEGLQDSGLIGPVRLLVAEDVSGKF